ncbi:MAG: hypothetical protein HYR63_03745 [Proteobacteria bacterium]|nr:hypothetical protein [Pseudomonadota bacterium]MBI3498573.1 hypothetical protein [Pseudomonadota bacterium]
MRSVNPTIGQDVFAVARTWLTGRRGLIVAAIVLSTVGLSLGWGWLAAIGVAPILLSVLPCLAMCALGICMQSMGGKSCSTQAGQAPSMPETSSVVNPPIGPLASAARPEPITIEGTFEEIPLEPAVGGDRSAPRTSEPLISKVRT